MNRFILIGAVVALPFSLLAGTLQTVTLDVQKYDLCGLSDHSQKSTLSSAWGNGRQSRFRQKTASVSFDPDKASPAALTKATADAGYPSSVQK
jgi:periplasmic mercuric ion binding protein